MKAEVNTLWGEMKKNWLIQVVNKFVFLLVVASLSLIIWRWNKLPPMVPLWYSRPWGSDQLAQPIWLFILPLGSLALYFTNLLISMYLLSEYLIFTQVLFLTSFIVSFLSFITLVKIVFMIV